MAEIRTKDSHKTPVKTLNRAENMAQRIRTGVKVTEKHSAEAAQSTSEDSYNARNADSFESGVKNGASETAHQSAKLTKKAAKKGVDKVESKAKEAIRKSRQKKAEKSVRQAQSNGRTATKAAQNSNAVKTAETNTKAIRTKTSEVTKKTIKDNAAKASKQTVKTAGKQSVKTAKHGIRTAQQTAKSSIKTSKEAAKVAQKTAKATEKAARTAVKAARAAAKAAAKTAQAIAKITIKIIQAIIAATKSLIAAIAAGGWIVVVIILVIVMIAMLLASVFGIFYSGEDSGTGMTMRDAITEINDEYNQKIEDIKSSNTYDALDMSGARAEWKNVLAVYAAKMNMDPDDPDEVVTMDESKKRKLKEVFWDMNEISHNVTSSGSSSSGGNTSSTTATERVTRTLHITVTHKTPDEMASQYHFSQDQIDSMHELLDSSNDALWSSLLHGITISGDSDIVAVAQAQLGNVGGQPYWSWYGFSSRVEWCCCFVSWCANECGYIDSGIIPRYSVVDDGANWFKGKNQWLDGNETPSPGMIIFFDWEYDGLDGSGDHTGIVEKVENGIVYTIEGNSGDACKENHYSVGHYEILGYGFYTQNNSSVSGTGDTASQVWTRLKSYGYSDSVVAGIMGNMMRECGGDTLDLDWSIVGNYNGDEYYGLCQWCLRYTPVGFKGSPITVQCDYLKRTIQSEFAAYGGNYGGITYDEFLRSDTRTAAIAFERVYERCGSYSSEDNRRANNAEVAYNRFHT